MKSLSHILSSVDIKKEIEVEDSTYCRIALFGRSGSGKSSIINKIIGQKVAETGIKTDTTRVRADFKHHNLILSDLPGFNTDLFPAGEYLEKFKILDDFDLYLCVLKDRIELQDEELFRTLLSHKKPCIFIRNKTDEIWNEEVDRLDLIKSIKLDFESKIGISSNELLFTSCKNGDGIPHLIEVIHQKAPETVRFQFVRSAKAYNHSFLERKKSEVERIIQKYALLSAANGINPIPGVDIAVDISILLAMFTKIKHIYGIEPELIEKYKHKFSATSKAVLNNLLKYLTKEGVLVVLKRFAGLEAGKGIGKYIPFVGQALASTAGYFLTRRAGKQFAADAHFIAAEILEFQ